MKRLFFVPIIHTRPEMGSLAPALEQAAIAELGQELWQRHQQTVAAFWDLVDRFLDCLDVRGFKVYQDGLVADGAEGLRIIREDISRKSRNFEIIGKLLDRGAVLVRTESLPLVKREYDFIARVSCLETPGEKEKAALRYKTAQPRLLRERDEFIAMRIRETLGEDESGVLFIGAYHDVLSRLPGDVQVTKVKDAAKVREYHKALASGEECGPCLRRLALELTGSERHGGMRCGAIAGRCSGKGSSNPDFVGIRDHSSPCPCEGDRGTRAGEVARQPHRGIATQ